MAGKPPWYCNPRTIACLVDFADLNDDDSIGYLELSAVLECDDIIQFAALVPNKKQSSQEKKDLALQAAVNAELSSVTIADYLEQADTMPVWEPLV